MFYYIAVGLMATPCVVVTSEITLSAEDVVREAIKLYYEHTQYRPKQMDFTHVFGPYKTMRRQTLETKIYVKELFESDPGGTEEE